MHTIAVYGTLRHGQRNHFLLDGATSLGIGFVAGALFDMPRNTRREYAYPALVEGAGRVAVEVYRLASEEMLKALDMLEDYDPADEASSEYIRRTVEIIDGPVTQADAYFYRGARDELGEPITTGEWIGG